MGSEKEAHFYVEPVAPQHVLFAEEVARKHYVRIHALAGAGVEKIVVLVLNFGGVGKVARQIGVEVGAETPANQVVALRAHARNYFVHLLLRIEHSGEVLRGTPVCALEFYADSAPVFELEIPVFRHRHAPVFARGLVAHLRGNVENRSAFDQKLFRIYGLPEGVGKFDVLFGIDELRRERRSVHAYSAAVRLELQRGGNQVNVKAETRRTKKSAHF